MGLHVLFGIGVSLRGHRRIVTVTECGPQDQSGMEAVLDDLSIRGLGSGMLLTVSGNVALHAAVSRVWGGRVRVQRCLNTVMAEALSGLDPDEALQFRHRLQQAWQQCDASQARTDLEQITTALTQVNRSSGSVLAHALESTLTLQRTGRLLHSDRGLRVLNSLRTLLARAGRRLTDTPVHQRGMHLCAALLELEPLTTLIQVLESRCPNAAASLKEGLEETLTLHKLGLPKSLRDRLRTTNIIESVNSRLAHTTRRITRWSNSDQRQRWIAAACLDIEQRSLNPIPQDWQWETLLRGLERHERTKHQYTGKLSQLPLNPH